MAHRHRHRSAALVVLCTLTSAVLAGCANRAVAPPAQDTSWFTSENESAAAAREIDAAKQTFNAVQAANSRFAIRYPRSCDAPEMELSIESLQKIEQTADRYSARVTATSISQEREANMDVADELYAMALDGYMEVADAYSKAGCRARAKHLYSELARVYSGGGFEKWRQEALKRVAEIKK